MGLFKGDKKDQNNKKVSSKAARVDSGNKVKAAEAKSMKDLYGSPEASKTVAGKTAAKKSFQYEQAHRVLLKPLVTEKVSNLGAENKYVFAVSNKANKIEVAKAIYQVYGIKPTKVNIIKMLGKAARYGRISGQRKDWKKAIITLPEGQTIKVYEGV